MFEFQFDEFPNTAFAIEAADLNLFGFVPPYQDKIALSIKITAQEQPLSHDGEAFEVQPVFDTQWLQIKLAELNASGVDCLDGYHMIYDEQREQELGFEQFPGAIYAHSWAGFKTAEMTLRHMGSPTYEITANGTTEFDWAFNLKVEAPLTKIDFATESRSKDPAVEALMHTHFSKDVFEFNWVDAYGGTSETWWHYRATPKT